LRRCFTNKTSQTKRSGESPQHNKKWQGHGSTTKGGRVTTAQQKVAEPQQHEKRQQSCSGMTKGSRVTLPTMTLLTKASFQQKEWGT